MRKIIIIIILLIVIGAGAAAAYLFFFTVEEPKIVEEVPAEPIIRSKDGYQEMRTRASFLDPANPKGKDRVHIEGNLIWYEMCNKKTLPDEVLKYKQTLMRMAVFRINKPDSEYSNLIKNIDEFVIDNYIELSEGAKHSKYFCDDIEFKLPENNIRYTEEEFMDVTHFYFNGKRK